mgnify:CR=1 FL=1
MEKFLENILEAEKNIQIADHMTYVTFPLIKDKRLLLKILQEIKNAVAHCVSSILQHDYLYKKIELYKDPKENFRTFIEKCASNCEITKEEIGLIIELFDFIEKHKQSPFEFVKDDKLIILSNGLKPKTLSIEKTKQFLILGKSILKKTREKFRRDID